jgi:hypothetical protein
MMTDATATANASSKAHAAARAIGWLVNATVTIAPFSFRVATPKIANQMGTGGLDGFAR